MSALRVQITQVFQNVLFQGRNRVILGTDVKSNKAIVLCATSNEFYDSCTSNCTGRFCVGVCFVCRRGVRKLFAPTFRVQRLILGRINPNLSSLVIGLQFNDINISDFFLSANISSCLFLFLVWETQKYWIWSGQTTSAHRTDSCWISFAVSSSFR